MTTKVSSGLVQDLANPNLFINGDFSVWQRGTSHVGITSGSSLYTADRWLCAVDSGSVDVTIGYGYEAGEQTNGCYILGSNAVGARINQRVEAAYLRAAEYKAVTLSLWVFSTVDVDLQWSPRSPVSEDDWSIVDSHGDFLLGSVPANLWTKLSFTLDLTSKVTTGFGGNITVLGTLNGGVTFSRVKLELGDVATPFVPDTPAVNLMKCQRYYWRPRADLRWIAYAPTTSVCYTYVTYPVQMRSAPSISITGTWNGSASGGAAVAVGYSGASVVGKEGCSLTFTAGATLHSPCTAIYPTTGLGLAKFDAEL